MSKESLQVITEAIQAHQTELDEHMEGQHGHPHIVINSVVVFELLCYDEDGQSYYMTTYCIPNDGTSLSASLGLLHAGLTEATRHSLGIGRDED